MLQIDFSKAFDKVDHADHLKNCIITVSEVRPWVGQSPTQGRGNSILKSITRTLVQRASSVTSRSGPRH